MNKKLTYAEAIEELEAIVAGMEDSEIDIDLLAEKVKRASYLIRYCRERLKSTDDEVRKVLDAMDGEPADEDGEH